MGQKESLNAWTDKLVKDLQRQNAAKASSARSIRNADVSGSKFNVQTVANVGNNDPGLGSRIIDVISRPLYAAANTVKEVDKSLEKWSSDRGIKESKLDENGKPFEQGMNPLEAAWRGLTGEDKTTFSDVIGESETQTSKVNPVVKAVGGLALDISLDPANLIAGGVGAAVKAAKGTKKAQEAALAESRLIRDAALTDSVKRPNPVNGAVTEKLADPGATSVIPPVRDYSAEIQQAGFTPEQYHKAVDEVIKLGNVVDPGSLSRIAKIPYAESNRILKQMEADGLVGPVIKKVSDKAHNAGQLARGRLSRPVLATSKPAGLWGEDVVANSNKIPEASMVANAHAPETVQPLPVENIPAPKQDFDLTPKGQGMLGSKAVSDALKNLADPVSGKPLYKAGVERAQALRSEALPAWKAEVEARAAAGAKPILYSADGTEYALSIPHVLERLPENVVDDMVFGASWGRYQRNANLYHTQIGRGMAEALRVDDLGLPLVDRYKQVSDAIKKAMPDARARKRQGVPLRQMYESAKALVDNTDAIREAQYEMAKTLVKKDLQDAAELAKNASTEIMAKVADPAVPTSDTAKILVGAGNQIQKAGQQIGASANATSIAAKEAATIIAKVAPEADTSAARATLAIKRERLAGSPDPKVSARQQNHLRVVEKESDNLLGVPVVELGVRVDNQLNGMIEHMLHPFRSKMTFGYGHQQFANEFRATGIERTARNVVNYNRELNNLSKKFGRNNLETAFSAFKRGEVPVEENALAAYQGMQRMVEHIFDTKDAYIGSFWRTGAGVDVINDALAKKGIPHRFDAAAKDVPNQWKEWDIKDPLDFLAKANDALTHVAGKQAFGTSFSHHFGVSTPRPGYVKMKTSTSDILGAFIDTSKYYPRESAEMMTRLEHTLKQPVSFRGETGTVAGIVNHLIDPVMQIWKPFMTILRPGHHVRNLFGDVMMGLLDGVSSVGSYRKGLKMMQSGGRLRGEGVEGLKAIEAGSSINGGSKMSTIRLRGRNVDLTYDNGYILANKHGLLPAGHAIEDLEKSTKGIEKFQNSAPMRAASRISEESGGFTRLAHFSNLMERRSFTRKFDSLEEAAAAAAAQVKKFHPDVHGLTPFERKYMRRIIPFYSWIRQALPVVMNTLITKPGRINYVNKAQYNVAQAMGLNPDSLSDPFPTDKLYPSFVTGHLTGPWFGDTTFNLGSPQEGILGDVLNGNPLRNAIGMVNPLLKAPVEMATQTNLSTGVPIQDMGEYVDSQLPVVNQVAGISGYSPTGTVAALLRGLPVPDPQRAVARGEKDHFFNASLVNFLTGLGVQNIDKPSYQKIALKEQSG